MKLNLKKWVALLLALMMIFSVTACTSSDSGNEPAAEEPATETETAEADYSSFPEKDIHVIYYTKAGSGGDTFARQVAKACEPLLNGHQIIVENIVDPTGAAAWSKVQAAEPDGYTIALLSTTVVGSDLILNSEVKYDDFEYICGLVTDPEYIVTKADSPFNNWEELEAWVKDHPGELKWGTTTPTGTATISSVGLINSCGLNVNRIVYDTGSDVLVALLGDFVDVCISEYGDVAPQIESGELKLIASLADGRCDLDIPTVKESGAIDWGFERVRGFAAPTGTDPALVEKLHEIFASALDNQEFKDYATMQAMVMEDMNGEDFLNSFKTIADVITENMDSLY